MKLYTAVWILLAVCFISAFHVKDVSAATGFQKIDGKTYYIKADGTKHTGWLYLNNNTYFFDTKTAAMVTGWVKSPSGSVRYFYGGSGKMATGWVANEKGEMRFFYPSSGIMATGWVKSTGGSVRYFYGGSGKMATGWVANEKGQKRYFNTNTGIMLTGWCRNSSYQYRYFRRDNGIMATGLNTITGELYYFNESDGIRCQKGITKVGDYTYCFATSSGKAYRGWLTTGGKKYYFGEDYRMYQGRTASIDGVNYTFDADGVSRQSNYVFNGTCVKVEEEGRTYNLVKEFLEHPGVADGTVSDLELLAIFAETEAGWQGFDGMEAAALSMLNRTISPKREFPRTLRYVLYQGITAAQYSVVKNGTVLKRLNGQGWWYKDEAFRAAQSAMNKFNAYVKNGTPRKVNGFPKEDFNYMSFMMPEVFFSLNLAFEKMDYFTYVTPNESTTFFVEWIDR